MPDGIPLFITGAFDIMSVDELELGVMSGTPGCNIPEPVGGVTETGGVFNVELPCAPGACYNNKLVISDINTFHLGLQEYIKFVATLFLQSFKNWQYIYFYIYINFIGKIFTDIFP